MKKTATFIALTTSLFLTGCANVHEFINGDFMTTVAPNASTLIKTAFYSDRYEFNVAPERIVPKDFANTAGDTFGGDYKFLKFTQDPNNKSQYLANYYKPTSANGNPTVLVETASFSRYPMKTQSGKIYQSTKISTEINCKNSTYSLVSGKAYSGKNLDGTIVTDKFADNSVKKSNPIIPDSYESILFNKVCS